MGRPRKVVEEPAYKPPKTDGFMISVQLWIRVDGPVYRATSPIFDNLIEGTGGTPDQALADFRAKFKELEEERLRQPH